jgi:hypothetical protein
VPVYSARLGTNCNVADGRSEAGQVHDAHELMYDTESGDEFEDILFMRQCK